MLKKIIALTFANDKKGHNEQMTNIKTYIKNQNRAELYGVINLPFTFSITGFKQLLQTVRNDKGIIVIDAKNIPEKLLNEVGFHINQYFIDLIILNHIGKQKYDFLVIIPENITMVDYGKYNATLIQSKLDNLKSIMNIISVATENEVTKIILINMQVEDKRWIHNPYIHKLQEISSIMKIEVIFASKLTEVLCEKN